jgi:hypothetical protein
MTCQDRLSDKLLEDARQLQQGRWKINGFSVSQSLSLSNGRIPRFIRKAAGITQARHSRIEAAKNVSFLRADYSASPAILLGVRQAAQRRST